MPARKRSNTSTSTRSKNESSSAQVTASSTSPALSEIPLDQVTGTTVSKPTTPIQPPLSNITTIDQSQKTRQTQNISSLNSKQQSSQTATINSSPSLKQSNVPFGNYPVPNDHEKTALRESEDVYLYEGRTVVLLAAYGDMYTIRDGGSIVQVLKNTLTPTGKTTLDPKKTSGRVNVNTCVLEELLFLKPYGIRSQTTAKHIIMNRQNGYRDFAHFQQVNSYLSSIDWQRLKTVIEF